MNIMIFSLFIISLLNIRQGNSILNNMKTYGEGKLFNSNRSLQEVLLFPGLDEASSRCCRCILRCMLGLTLG